MYIPSSLRCHDTGAGSLCAQKVTHRFETSAETAGIEWVYFECSADAAHVTGYEDRVTTD